MSIKLLDKSVYNKIAAGEVVEKPASIVKELLENSIDAGAKNISIEIENGGISKIKVSDDGCGIKQDEIKLAFMPHATSKLEKIDDLYNLNTMGFRGEALSSISAVSNVEIISKTDNEDLGIKALISAGEEIEREQIATVTGTTIIVSNLFYNTPARAKFLRKPKTEEKDITNYVEKLMMANPNINFKYIIDSKLIYNTSSMNLDTIIYTIYGKEIYDSLLKVDYNINGYKIVGFISKPNYYKSNRTYQTLYVNGRFCQNILVSTAIQNAYENFLMKGKFPFYVLNLIMPKSSVDVNVHPNKLEVKFENTNLIYSIFNNAVYEALTNFSQIKKVDIDENEISENVYNEPINNNSNLSNSIKPFISSYSTKENTDRTNNDKVNNGIETNNLMNQISKITLDEGISFNKEQEISLNSSSVPQEVDLYNYKTNFTNDRENLMQVEDNKTIKQEKLDFYDTDFKICGKAFNTYLFVEKDDKLFVIDQHAAHERQMYDKIIKQIEKNQVEIQKLLIPYNLFTNNDETDFINDNLIALQECGFEIYQSGDNLFTVSAIPLIISNLNIKECFDKLFSNLNNRFTGTLEFNKEQFMQQACKSAVKGGDDLKPIEISSLFKELKDKKSVLLCPHGRPIVIELTKTQLEKWFKRIV